MGFWIMELIKNICKFIYKIYNKINFLEYYLALFIDNNKIFSLHTKIEGARVLLKACEETDNEIDKLVEEELF